MMWISNTRIWIQEVGSTKSRKCKTSRNLWCHNTNNYRDAITHDQYRTYDILLTRQRKSKFYEGTIHIHCYSQQIESKNSRDHNNRIAYIDQIAIKELLFEIPVHDQSVWNRHHCQFQLLLISNILQAMPWLCVINAYKMISSMLKSKN